MPIGSIGRVLAAQARLYYSDHFVSRAPTPVGDAAGGGGEGFGLVRDCAVNILVRTDVEMASDLSAVGNIVYGLSAALAWMPTAAVGTKGANSQELRLSELSLADLALHDQVSLAFSLSLSLSLSRALSLSLSIS